MYEHFMYRILRKPFHKSLEAFIGKSRNKKKTLIPISKIIYMYVCVCINKFLLMKANFETMSHVSTNLKRRTRKKITCKIENNISKGKGALV